MKQKFNNFELDTRLFELRDQGVPVSIEPQTYNVLAYLLAHRERVVSKQELLDNLWEGRVVSESSLNTCIKAARKAVNDNGQDQNTIATVYRRGYRFIADVGEIADQQSGSAEPTQAEAAMDASCLAHVDDRLSLVVIPFSHSQDDADAAWWAEVFSEDISIHLARISGFMVISRHSAAALGGHQNKVLEIGKELGTQYVVEGSVGRFNDEYRISVQLIDVNSGQLIWAKRKRLSAENIDDFQSDVVQKIVAQIEPELNRAELSILRHRKPVDMGAWSLCREAAGLLGQKGWSESTFSEVADLLRNAIHNDPTLAFAHAYLSLIIALGHLIGLVHQDDWKQEATQAAETALSLDSQDSDVLGHVGCAFADMGDYQRGIPLMKRAIELNPGNAQAWAALGAAKLRTGDESGVDEMRRGLRISPRDTRLAAWGALLAQGLLFYGRAEEAIEAAQDACRYDDKIFLPRVILAIAQCVGGDTSSAKIAWQDARRIRPQLGLDDIRWMARPREIGQLKAMGIN